MKYFKIYHYSRLSNLEYIDPDFYGTWITTGSECKHGKTGLNKSYFYTIDEPETCLASTHRYEIYLPYDWHGRIYDLSKDPLKLYDQIKNEIISIHNRLPYDYELKEGVETRIKELGYKGWQASDFSPLPHAVMLFYKISTQKPADAEIVYDWKRNILERNSPVRPLYSLGYRSIFKPTMDEKTPTPAILIRSAI